MKDQILHISDRLKNNQITDNEARKLLLELFFISDEALASHGLTIKYVDYGLWKLRQNGEYLMEAERLHCNERAIEIIQKNNKPTNEISSADMWKDGMEGSAIWSRYKD